MANCCGKCLSVIAVIPVLGRLPLLHHTITRLIKKNGVSMVICVGQTAEEQATCEGAGAEFIAHRNHPLGRKWNAGFMHAKKYNPDACLFVGSSDWLSDNWISELSPHMNKYDLVGLPGCYFVDIAPDMAEVYRLVYWPGYEGKRLGESIGIGRLISAKALDNIDWRPFDDHLDNSMDYSMYRKINDTKRHLVVTDKIFSMSISTNRWPNKHSFDQHWFGTLKSDRVKEPVPFLMNHFPEVFEVFKV